LRGGVAVLDHLGGLDTESQDLLMDWLEARDAAAPGRGARVIAIANLKLPALVEEGKFSEGLYYRLSRVELDVPDLTRRRKDILVLARAFLSRVPSPIEPAKRELSMRTSACFLSYPWPGNVQELMGAVESGLWATLSGTVEIEDLPQRLIAYYEEHKADIQRDVINVIKGPPAPSK
jgi:two-component system response regulator AtoC